MSKIINAALAIALSLAACTKRGGDERSAGPEAQADSVFTGGVIHTGLAAEPTVEAVAVEDGRIIAAGARADIDRLIGPDTDVIDLGGAALYPGFVDAHAHLLGVGMRELTLNLEGVSSLGELVDIIAAAAQETAEGDTIYGRGWIETGWPEARFPSRFDLDEASVKHPIVIVRADGHALAANSAAIEKAGVTRETQDPEGGRIERDAKGEPSGMFIDNAMGLVERLVAAPSDGMKREAYAVGAGVYAASGWTGLHNMSVDPADVALIEQEAADGRVAIRVYNALDEGGLDALAAGPRFNNSGRIITRAVKLYVDGALGSRGAALAAPYSDMPETSGLLLMTHE
ncbi:MAG: amidohydrolase, partial [Pseudomonadota bacterium]